MAGPVGSAFHAAAFFPDPMLLVLLSRGSDMLDRVAGLDAGRLSVDSDLVDISAAERTSNRFRINDPAATARGVLRCRRRPA